MADAGDRCFAHDPERVRKPHVSFIRLDRMPRDVIPGFRCLVSDILPARQPDSEALKNADRAAGDA